MMTIPLQIPTEILEKVRGESVRCYPNEACGFLLGTIGKERKAIEFKACRNTQDEWHARDPERYPRTATTAYLIDPVEQKKIEDEARGKGWQIVAIVHSHPEHDAYFSDEDKASAAPWGEPLFENVSYIVASVFDRQVKEINLFDWDEAKKDFVQRTL